MNEKQLNDLIEEKRQAYQAKKKSGELTVNEQESLTKEISTLQTQRSELIATGAKVCKRCGNKPMGMLRTPAIFKNGAQITFPIYEVGCTVCAPTVKPDPTDEKHEIQVSVSAWGNSPETAVENWNNRVYVEKRLEVTA